MVNTTDFITRVSEQFQHYGNVITDPLKRAWKQICYTFNEQIQNASNPETKVIWKALQSPTGSGKTLCMKVYGAMLSTLPTEKHPGMLIVTRLIESADSLADDINRLAREYNPSLSHDVKVAISYHSKSKADLQGLKNYPVLVICHAAYVSALEKLGDEATVRNTWDYFYPFINGERKLIVIDEAINLVEEYQLTRDKVERALALCGSLEEEFPVEIQAIRTIHDILKITEAKKIDKPLTVVHKPLIERFRTKGELIQAFRNGEPLTGVTEEEVKQYEARMIEEDSAAEPLFNLKFNDLKKALNTIRLDEKILAKEDSQERARLFRLAEEAINAVNAIFKSWVYAGKDRKYALATAKLLVPDDIKGAVILDATAGVNLCYDLFPQCIPVEPPKGARDYQNVTVHHSQNHRVGKEYMEENTPKVCEALMKELEGEFGGRSVKPNVLIVTHKSVEPMLKSYDADNFSFNVAHWNAIDGSNEWSEYDTVVIFGLPYKPKSHSMNLFQAFQGVQSTEWLQAEGNRPFTTREGIVHDDILRGLAGC